MYLPGLLGLTINWYNHEQLIDIFPGWWFGTFLFYDFPFSWECHHPNWRTPSFVRRVGWNHQPGDNWWSFQPEWWYTGHIASYLRVVFWRDYMSDFDHFSSGYRWIWGVHCNRRSTEDRPLGRRTTYDNLLDDIGLGAMPERSYSLLTEAAESFGEVDLRRSPGQSPGKNKFCVCPRATRRVTWLVLFWHLDTRSW